MKRAARPREIPKSHSPFSSRLAFRLCRQNFISRALTIGSLSTHVFETRTATGREHFACQESIVSRIFVLLISNGEKLLSNVNVVVCGQVKNENSSLPVARPRLKTARA